MSSIVDTPNQLIHEKSPYLLQHAHNPVHWQPWGQRAFEEARALDRPIFLSIGYSVCHWCHVMAHESFEDQRVAALLNEHFVSIKVDREERPDVDAIYMAACQALTGSGGWPLTILMTSDQKPFYAGTYLPRDALCSLLDAAARRWKQDRDGLLRSGEALSDFLRKQSETSAGTIQPAKALPQQARRVLARAFDAEWGGFGGAPKFPTPHNLMFLMNHAQLEGDQKALRMVEITLERMYRGGIFDHVGGGFARYSTDRRWLVPHFEKMLYDNALLTLAYAQAYRHTGKVLYREVAESTIDYVLRELTDPEGGFYCSQDADSEGVEGRYYVFSPEECRSVLGEAAGEAFCQAFDITARGNFEGMSIPNLIKNKDWAELPVGLRRELYTYRLDRHPLHRDDKVLTSWNALMIAALSYAARAFGRWDYLDAACRARDFIEKTLARLDGRLLARWRQGDAAIPGTLDDYAFYAWALLELNQTLYDPNDLKRAMAVADRMVGQFLDERTGGFFLSGADEPPLIARTRETYDGALPSGNSVAALVLSRLDRLTGRIEWRDRARKQFAFLAGAAQGNPSGHTFALLAMQEALYPSRELVAACADQQTAQGVREALWRSKSFGLTALIKTPDNQALIGEVAPFTAEYPLPTTGATYYLCEGGTCRAPLYDLNLLPI